MKDSNVSLYIKKKKGKEPLQAHPLTPQRDRLLLTAIRHKGKEKEMPLAWSNPQKYNSFLARPRPHLG
jgi:hypothetical protein